MRIFKSKWFAKFARKEEISDEKLIQAVIDRSFFIVKVKKPSLFMVLPRM